MNKPFTPVIDILYAAETARKEGCRRVCELLSLDPTSTIAHILDENEKELGDERFDALLEEVAKILGEHRIKKSITDWPFEHFWGNPSEPKHSKLLGYFIDPSFGPFLLNSLLKVLEPNEVFPTKHCRVRIEDGLNGRVDGRIDILIEHDHDEGRYAVIIENKINWAIDQDRQLQKYVEGVHQHFQGRLDYKKIYVFYLPLTNAKNPNPDDEAAIRKYGVNYNKITFETHILKWLDTVLAKEAEPEWPGAMNEGMRENLSHYRNLVTYLVNKQKEFKMDAKILNQLRKLAEENGTPPTLSGIKSLKDSTEKLEQCMRHVLRGKLLLEVQTLLKQQGRSTWFCLESDPKVKISFGSPYDERFDGHVTLCLPVDDSVSVCFGGNSSGFWLAYMRNGSPDMQKTVEEIISLEAKDCLKPPTGKDYPWYAWGYTEVAYYDRCVEDYAPVLAQKLIEMRENLINRLRNSNGGQYVSQEPLR